MYVCSFGIQETEKKGEMWHEIKGTIYPVPGSNTAPQSQLLHQSFETVILDSCVGSPRAEARRESHRRVHDTIQGCEQSLVGAFLHISAYYTWLICGKMRIQCSWIGDAYLRARSWHSLAGERGVSGLGKGSRANESYVDPSSPPELQRPYTSRAPTDCEARIATGVST